MDEAIEKVTKYETDEIDDEEKEEEKAMELLGIEVKKDERKRG